MPIISKKLGLAYFDTPKVASSSIKYALYEAEHGRPFEHEANVDDAIHWTYPTRRLQPEDWARTAGLWTFGVVRDPVKRLLSAYANRVALHADQRRGRLSTQRARLLGLSLTPDADTFFTRLGRYRLAAGPVRHHTDRVMRYLGDDLSRFDAIYPIEDLASLEGDLSRRTGAPVRLQRLQTGGPKLRFDMLSAEAQDALMRYLAPEYRVLARYYQPPRDLATE